MTEKDCRYLCEGEKVYWCSFWQIEFDKDKKDLVCKECWHYD